MCSRFASYFGMDRAARPPGSAQGHPPSTFDCRRAQLTCLITACCHSPALLYRGGGRLLNTCCSAYSGIAHIARNSVNGNCVIGPPKGHSPPVSFTSLKTFFAPLQDKLSIYNTPPASHCHLSITPFGPLQVPIYLHSSAFSHTRGSSATVQADSGVVNVYDICTSIATS